MNIRRILLLSFGVFLAIGFAYPVLAAGETPTLPADYATWEKTYDEDVRVSYQGEATTVHEKDYARVNEDGTDGHLVVEFSHPGGAEPWFIVHIHQWVVNVTDPTGEVVDHRLAATQELWEWRDGAWTFVEDVSELSPLEIIAKYNLEILPEG